MCLIIPHIHSHCQHPRRLQLIEPCPLYRTSRPSTQYDPSQHTFTHVLHTVLIGAPSLCPSCYRGAEDRLRAHHDLEVEEEQDVLEAFVEELADAKSAEAKAEGKEGERALRERNVRVQMGRWAGAVRRRDEAIGGLRRAQGVWGDG